MRAHDHPIHNMISKLRPSSLPSPASRLISAMLSPVRNFLYVIIFLSLLPGCAIPALFAAQAPAPPPQQQASPPPAAQNPPPQPAAPAPSGPVIVLDPAHGGTDNGARGENGVFEKDIVLKIARSVRSELARRGYRVVLTRDDDSNPSYDDRAAIANAYSGAIFITLHIASTGTAGTARAYYYRFWTPLPSTPISGPDTGAAKSVSPAGTLVTWAEAQRSAADSSHLLADLMQIQLAQLFPGSPVTSSGAAVRELRSVAAPAVALELSSVAVSNPDSLVGAAAPLAAAIDRSLPAFHAAKPAGSN